MPSMAMMPAMRRHLGSMVSHSPDQMQAMMAAHQERTSALRVILGTPGARPTPARGGPSGVEQHVARQRVGAHRAAIKARAVVIERKLKGLISSGG